MASSSNQQIAWLFILLLAGHEVAEAARIRKRSKPGQMKPQDTFSSVKTVGTPSQDLAPVPEDDHQAELMWQSENAKCGSYGIFCGAGPASKTREDVHRCALRPLNGDIKTSVKCRVTDEWMLQGTTEKPVTWWVTLQVKLMQAKSAKYAEDCKADGKSSLSWRCMRRTQHMLRAMTFISKAASQGAISKMSMEEQKELQMASASARDAMAVMMAEDKQALFHRLVNTFEKDTSSLQKDPKGAIENVLQVLEQDILPDEADPKVAEEKIKEMEANAKPAEPEKDDARQKRMDAVAADIVGNPGELAEIFDGTGNVLDADVLNHDETRGNSTSLVQLQDQGEKVVKYVGFGVIAVLLVLSIIHIGGVIVSALITWVAISLLGCAAYVSAKMLGVGFGGNAMAAHADANRWLQEGGGAGGRWGSCVATWVSAPFILMYRSAKYLFSKVKAEIKDD